MLLSLKRLTASSKKGSSIAVLLYIANNLNLIKLLNSKSIEGAPIYFYDLLTFQITEIRSGNS
jgi:hypothetical protein